MKCKIYSLEKKKILRDSLKRRISPLPQVTPWASAKNLTAALPGREWDSKQYPTWTLAAQGWRCAARRRGRAAPPLHACSWTGYWWWETKKKKTDTINHLHTHTTTPCRGHTRLNWTQSKQGLFFPGWKGSGSGGLYDNNNFLKIPPTAVMSPWKCLIILKSFNWAYILNYTSTNRIFPLLSYFPWLKDFLILFSLKQLFYMRQNGTTMYSGFDTLFFPQLII